MHISIVNPQQNEERAHHEGPIYLGRDPKPEGAQFVILDRYVSRNQLRIDPLPGNRVRLENCGTSLTLPDGSELPRGESRELPLPVRLAVGYTEVHLEADRVEHDQSLHTISRPIRQASSDDAPPSLINLGESPSPTRLAVWFETLLGVQRSAAGSDEFYAETARAVVELVGLDRGLVLLRRGKDWQVRASQALDNRRADEYSRSVLHRVCEERRTYYQSMDEETEVASLAMIEAVVASPIFGQDDRSVLGVVYGSRDLRTHSGKTGVTPLEAQVIQLLAGACSAGLARQDQEAEAARMRVQFERFSSPELSRELERNPHLLDPTQRELTILFADLRGFTRMSEQMDAEVTYRLASEYLDALTHAILSEHGVIIDYYGDGVAAMWNAPTQQAAHAAMACRAARKMHLALPELNRRWQSELKRELRIGVGIHTGTAQVGNAGSQQRVKYGPRGHTVNLASRLESATKQVGVGTLISGSTAAQIGEEFTTRRLGQVQVVGTESAIDVFELHTGSASPEWLEWRETYEHALSMVESGQYDLATQTLQSNPDDGPTRLLLDHSLVAKELPEPLRAVIRLDKK